MDGMYHEGNRELQERFDTRRLADRIENLLVHDTFTDRDKGFVESRDMFFFATADEQGRPNVSYKGGDPGFVRIVDEHTLAFPNYNGNGMYLSMGNLLRNPHVGILFMDFEGRDRMRVNRRGVGGLRRRAEIVVAGSPVRGPGAGSEDLPELPEIRAPLSEGRGVGVRASRGLRDAGAVVEAGELGDRRSARGRSRPRSRRDGRLRWGRCSDMSEKERSPWRR
jgi:predicted pyridoxine 5'-phosphate oxidase superfamily flavin-nucleotide-binding protein